MCFINDGGDWCASYESVECALALVSQLCCECGDVIHPGEWHEVVTQIEYEECILGDDSSCDYSELHDCGQGGCDYGEEYTGYTCVNCLRLLAAIYEVEKEAHCHEDSRRPSYGNMYEEVFSYYVDHRDAYIATWLEMFPGATHKFVTQYEESKLNGD